MVGISGRRRILIVEAHDAKGGMLHQPKRASKATKLKLFRVSFESLSKSCLFNSFHLFIKIIPNPTSNRVEASWQPLRLRHALLAAAPFATAPKLAFLKASKSS